MKINEIFKAYGTEYKEMTIRLLEKSGLEELIGSRDRRIAIKPNLVACTPASYGATTHPEIVSGIIEYLQDRQFRNITIMEGSWIGDKTSEAYEYCGYRELCEKYNVSFVDTQKEKSFITDCAGMELSICDCYRDLDFLINVPVLKGHCQTKITCALKNMKGLIPNSEKRRFHTIGLHKPIAHLNSFIHQDFIVVDHICGDLDFEEGGNPVVKNCIMTARDPVLVDAYTADLLGYKPYDIEYVELAEKLGIGSADLDNLVINTIEGENIQEISNGNHRKILDVNYAVQDVDSCSACYSMLIYALDRLREEGLLDRLEEKISIGQGYKGKKGRLGIGNCTAAFDINIKGCPPGEKEIYMGLKEYIERNTKA